MLNVRGILMACAALALLGAGVWLSERAEKAKEGKPDPKAAPKILEIPSDQIEQVEIDRAGEVTRLTRGADNQWTLKAPSEFRADQDAASGLVNTFNSLASDQLVDEKAGDLTAFGLASPPITVAVTKKDGKTAKLLLGDETPTGAGIYVKLDGDPRVFTMATFNKSSLDKSFKDLQDKRLLTFDADKITRVELSVKGETLEFGKNTNNEWQIVKPAPMRADGNAVEELVRRLRDAKMDAFASEDEAGKAAASFGSGAVVAVAKVTDAAGTGTLEVRKAADGSYFAKGSALEGIHKASSDLGDGLAKATSDYRNKKLFDFGWNDPAKVEIRSGDKVRTFTKTGEEWKEGSITLDAPSVQNLVDKLRDLQAISFGGPAPQNAAFHAIVTWSQGKRNEKVLIAKTGDTITAQRDGEPTIYTLDKPIFEGLEQAASSVKAPEKETKGGDKKK